ncbi:MAG: ECF-type sigma factor [Phycisphaerales bacterium]|nr:ECF-type sigma factor [Phycisphaerales bacterium]
MTTGSDITRLLHDAKSGDARALDALWDAVYTELRQMAHVLMAREKQQPDLQPSIIVSDLYLRTAENVVPDWNDRRHFFGCSWRVMRQIVIDYARKRDALKRGGDRNRIPLEVAVGSFSTLCEFPDDAEDIFEAMDRLHGHDHRQFEIFWRRWAFGHTYRQIAEDLQMGETTARDEWRHARAWIRKELDLEPEARCSDQGRRRNR